MDNINVDKTEASLISNVSLRTYVCQDSITIDFFTRQPGIYKPWFVSTRSRRDP